MIITPVKMLRIHWLSVIAERPTTFSETQIDSDGRTRAKTIRGLVADGTIQPVPEAAGRFALTATLLDTTPAERPDLGALSRVEKRDEYDLSNLRGVLLADEHSAHRLTPANLRYIAEHVGEYRFVDRWGTPVAERAPRLFDTYVCDLALDAAVHARRLALRTAQATARNLYWGLREIGALIEGDPTAPFKSDNTIGFGDDPAFNADPDQWGDDAQRVLAALRARIAADLAAIDAVTRADAFVRGRGGWAAFVAEYRAMILCSL